MASGCATNIIHIASSIMRVSHFNFDVNAFSFLDVSAYRMILEGSYFRPDGLGIQLDGHALFVRHPIN